MSSKSHIFGAVDIGTSKVTVLIAELTSNRALEIIGMGRATSAGLVKGCVDNFRQASDSVHRALMDAERSAGTHLSEVFLAQSGGHLEGFYNEAAVNVSSADNMVSFDDMERVNANARAKQVPDGRVIIHQLPRPYRLDGKSVPDPENLTGRRLEVGYWTIHGQENRVHDHMHIVTGFNVKIAELIHAGLASGTILTTPEERQQGVVVIDIGEGTTDYVLYRDGCAQTAGTLAVGGNHLTNDLALGLRLNHSQAEKVKLEHGRSQILAKDKSEQVWLNGTFEIGDRKLFRHSIEMITSTRTHELFEVVKKKLGSAFDPELTPTGLILTGGGSLLPGIEEAAAHVFGLPARLGEFTVRVADSLNDPRCSTVLGLLHHGLNSQADAAPRPRHVAVTSLLRKLFT